MWLNPEGVSESCLWIIMQGAVQSACVAVPPHSPTYMSTPVNTQSSQDSQYSQWVLNAQFWGSIDETEKKAVKKQFGDLLFTRYVKYLCKDRLVCEFSFMFWISVGPKFSRFPSSRPQRSPKLGPSCKAPICKSWVASRKVLFMVHIHAMSWCHVMLQNELVCFLLPPAANCQHPVPVKPSS